MKFCCELPEDGENTEILGAKKYKKYIDCRVVCLLVLPEF
jgi:hypothetical protein